jgi:hypothetical protein
VDLYHARRAATAFVVVLFAVFAFAVPATADTPLGHRGMYGVHYLADSEEYPGARCAYDQDQNLAGIRVLDPFVFARNRTSGPDRQRVGWRFIVQERLDESSDWTDIARSPLQRGVASDSQPADFDPMGILVGTEPGARYRVKVRMFWFGPRDTKPHIQGVATHLVDWYRYPLADANPGFCPGGIL